MAEWARSTDVDKDRWMSLSIGRTGWDGGNMLPPCGRNILGYSIPECVENNVYKLTMIRTQVWGSPPPCPGAFFSLRNPWKPLPRLPSSSVVKTPMEMLLIWVAEVLVFLWFSVHRDVSLTQPCPVHSKQREWQVQNSVCQQPWLDKAEFKMLFSGSVPGIGPGRATQ